LTNGVAKVLDLEGNALADAQASENWNAGDFSAANIGKCWGNSPNQGAGDFI
jgi:hypothetical protein